MLNRRLNRTLKSYMYENIGLLQCMGSSFILGLSKVLLNPKKEKEFGNMS